METREFTYNEPLQVRESTEEGVESRTVEGYAVVFGVPSIDLSGGIFEGGYHEYIDRESVNKTLLDKCDIKLTMFHDRQLILGRSNNGVGTLKYSIDERGVKFECDMPHTIDGDKALELVKRGDIAGCSFAFIPDAVDTSWDEKSDTYTAHIRSMKDVRDFTLAADPAYKQTSISARELEDIKNLKDNLVKKAVEERENEEKKVNIVVANDDKIIRALAADDEYSNF